MATDSPNKERDDIIRAAFTPEGLALLTDEERRLLEQITAPEAQPLWAPFPNTPQETAYWSKADEIYFGGAAAAGKSGLGVGLAITQHVRSLLLRREATQAGELVDQVRHFVGARGRWRGWGKGGTMTMDDGRTIEIGGCDSEDDAKKYAGVPHDFICYDEAPAFSRSQVKFISGWNRSSNPNQRCRILLPGNPPRSSEERWIVEEFAPWLDNDFPNPARAGELRWYSFLKMEGDKEAKLCWFVKNDPFEHNGEMIYPRSRTFIPGRLSDNPILSKTNDYKATLQSLPEPLRSQLLYGDFSIGTSEDPWQVIPTAWVREAQKRWRPGPPEDSMMTAMGVDPAYGGSNATVIACRYGDWFAPLLKYPGESTPDGESVAALVIRAHKDQAVVNVDIGGTAGGAAYEALRKQKWLHTTPINNSSAVGGFRDRSGQLKCKNIRAASYWKLREALDPNGPIKLALPPDNMLLADLCVAKYTITGAIQLEEKRDIIARIGRSPDAADAVVLAYWATPQPIVGGFRVLYTKPGNQKFRVVVCSWLELAALAIEEQTAVVVGFIDVPHIGDELLPVPSKLDNMLEMVTVRCADLAPEETREKWGELVEPWNRKLEDIVASEDDGKRMWRVLFKHRSPFAQVMVFVDNGGDDRRALSAAYAVCDAMHLNRKESVWQTGGTQLIEQPPNRHVYGVVRAARHRVVE